MQDLAAVVLSHAHIDHSGRLPLLVKAGFGGSVVTTEPTARLLEILLADSGRIQEEDARWKIKRLKKRGKDASWVRPLYTEEDALAVIDRLETVPFSQPHSLDGVGTVTFVPAGHILGAAIVDLALDVGGKRRRLVFSGDLGVHGAKLLGRPRPVPCPDYLIMDSTYGDRQRKEEGDRNGAPLHDHRAYVAPQGESDHSRFRGRSNPGGADPPQRSGREWPPVPSTRVCR